MSSLHKTSPAYVGWSMQRKAEECERVSYIEMLPCLKVLAIIYTFAEIIFDYFSMLYNEENKQLSVGHSVH